MYFLENIFTNEKIEETLANVCFFPVASLTDGVFFFHGSIQALVKVGIKITEICNKNGIYAGV